MEKKQILKNSVITAVAAATTFGLMPTLGVQAADLSTMEKPSLTYSAHVSNIGWMDPAKAADSEEMAEIAGTTGRALQAEAFKINFQGPEDVTIKYNVHSQNIGWTGWVNQGEKAGTEGKVLQAEAIKISVEGLDKYGYELKYRAHVKNLGWQDWVTADNGDNLEISYAGTTGKALWMEALEIIMVKTDQAKLEEAQQSVVDELTNYVENSALKQTVAGSDMDYASVPDIQNAIAEGYASIWNTNSLVEAQAVLEETKANIVKATKEYNQFLLDTIYNNGEEYYGLMLLEDNYNQAKAKIEEAEAVEDAISAYTEALNARLTLEEYNVYEAVNTAIAQLEEYVDEESYTINAEELAKAIEDGKTAISEKTTIKEVSAALSEAKAAIDAIATDEEEAILLEEEQNKAVSELTSYVENSALKRTVLGSDMDYAAVPDIQNAVAKGYATIGETKATKDVEAALETAKAEIVNATKEYNQFLLDTIYNNGEEFYDLILTNAQYEEATATINEAKDVETAINAYENAANSRTTLSGVQEKALNEFTSYVENSVLKQTVPGSDMDYLAVPDINSVVAATYSKVYSAKSQAEIDSVINETKNDILEATRGYVDFLLDTVYEYGFNEYGLFLQKTDYQKAKNTISTATSVDDIISAYNTALDTRVEA